MVSFGLQVASSAVWVSEDALSISICIALCTFLFDSCLGGLMDNTTEWCRIFIAWSYLRANTSLSEAQAIFAALQQESTEYDKYLNY
jgi:hypothetical protein